MNNTYGSIKGAVIDTHKDVEIFYNYKPTYNSVDVNYSKFKRIKDVSSILKPSNVDDDTRESNLDPYLPGMYNLSLPVSIFGRKGYYTIYIKPREIRCTIKDVGTLGAYPDVSGIVIDTQDKDVDDYKTLFSDDGLTGYRVEYYQYTGSILQRQEFYRLITSNNLVEPITQNLTSANTDAHAYRFNQSGSLCFLTLTPSLSPRFKANSKPFIGVPSQKISISNTKFDPICLRLEICENDFDTLATSIDGNQIRSLDNGILTTYNSDNEVFRQWDFYTLKDNYNKNARFEVKKRRLSNIDTTANSEEIFKQ